MSFWIDLFLFLCLELEISKASVKGFDGRGNYTLGIKEQIIFPEIKVDEIKK